METELEKINNNKQQNKKYQDIKKEKGREGRREEKYTAMRLTNR